MKDKTELTGLVIGLAGAVITFWGGLTGSAHLYSFGIGAGVGACATWQAHVKQKEGEKVAFLESEIEA